MSRRMSGVQRREQIVQATLELLGEHGVAAATTREIARRVGLTQPGLFKHFRNREAILAAAIHQTREQLAAELLASLDGGSVLERLRQLGAGLMSFSRLNPWLPQLLFHTASLPPGHPMRPVLLQLPSMQRALVEDLLSQGVRSGELPETLDCQQAATAFVSMIVGSILSAHLEGLRSGAGGAAALEMWLAGAEAGVPKARSPAPAPGEHLIFLDARPIFAAGDDPLPSVLAALSRLLPGGLLLFSVPFLPRPLIALLTRRGLDVTTTREPDGFALWIGHPAPMDLRELEAPDPLEHILLALAALEPGDSIVARTPRLPAVLLPRLAERGLNHHTMTLPDGSALVCIRKPA